MTVDDTAGGGQADMVFLKHILFVVVIKPLIYRLLSFFVVVPLLYYMYNLVSSFAFVFCVELPCCII